ncbi:MAG: Jag N-terminal domain-containing protein [Peptococcaceae bacterium]|jgi:spoIIIJ-associated protein|nr:Jag N-terminal domain-containing protein [Peptococcaceae bacterium]
MSAVEKTAKTVEEAISLALRELACDESQVEIEVLSAPAKGFLGIGILGAKDARVKVRLKGTADEKGGSLTAGGEKEAAAAGGRPGGEPAARHADTAAPAQAAIPAASGKPGEAIAVGEWRTPEATDKIAGFIQGAVTRMGIEAVMTKNEDDAIIRYALNGPRMGALIGHRGDTLDALQYLASVIAGREREEPRKRIVLDAESYRRRREETLVRLAHRLAAKAKRGRHRMVLEPMSPMERRVIHTALQDDPEVKTLSEGDEPYRRLVIYPVGKDGEINYDQAGERQYDRVGGDRRGGAGRYGGRDDRRDDWKDGRRDDRRD